MALVDQYKTIIFDFGAVLVSHQTENDQAQMAELLHLSPQIFNDLYWSRRAEYDRGDLTTSQYWQDIAERGNSQISASLIEQLTTLDTESWLHFDEVMWDWLKELRADGKRLGILSNMPRDLGEALKKKKERMAAVDHATLSYEVDLTKPDAAIYKYCLQQLGAEAKDALFFDDRPENVEAAERVGIRSIQFLDRDKVLADVRGVKLTR
jgi:putative hydrolase of the HAD superfamily